MNSEYFHTFRDESTGTKAIPPSPFPSRNWRFAKESHVRNSAVPLPILIFKNSLFCTGSAVNRGDAIKKSM